MQKYLIKLVIGLMAALLLLMVASTVVIGQTPEADLQTAESFVDKFCFNGEVANMDVSDLVDEYTDKTNQFFNEKIRYIMTNLNKDEPTPDLNTYKGGFCKDKDGKEVSDLTCQSIAVCSSTEEYKAHPYCVAVLALGFSADNYGHYDAASLQNVEQLKYSYMCYRAALNSKRNSLYDGTPQGIFEKCDRGITNVGSKDISKICTLYKNWKDEQDPTKKAVAEKELNKELDTKRWWSTNYKAAITSATATLIDLGDSTAKKVEFIDQEVQRAKDALDKTLDAYSQMRMAWKLHVKYMDNFAELVKYRDYLVSIRKKTDTFPFKFIDATTTKCL